MTSGPEPFTRGEPFFEDGNIILLADENIAFRLHRGVLARHSDIFNDIFGMPQPTGGSDSGESAVDMYDGCQIVRMDDHPLELANLVKGLYDGVTFHNRSLQDFFYLASILKLSTKYFVSQLRLKAIEFLLLTWSHTLSGHDDLVRQALSSSRSDSDDRTTFPHVHPLHVLNLARQTNVDIVIPCVTYFLSLYPLEDVLKGDHPKLKIGLDHPSRPDTELTRLDLKNYSLMFQYRLEAIMYFIRQFCDGRKPSHGCTRVSSNFQNSTPSTPVTPVYGLARGRGTPNTPNTPTSLSYQSNVPDNVVTTKPCSRVFDKLATRLSKSWQMRTGPLHYMIQATQEILNEDSRVICAPCKKAFEEDVQKLREKIWAGLPSVLGMPPWEVLQRDLEGS